jgi:DNA-binding NarL/FixJ family response regulator
MAFWKSKQAKQAYKVWRKRLEESGFRDIESKNETLSHDASKTLKRLDALSVNARMEYYYLLCQHVNEHKFVKERDKQIMSMLGEGVKTKVIAGLLKIHKQTVRFTRRKYENLWGIRVWSKQQMTSNRIKPRMQS